MKGEWGSDVGYRTYPGWQVFMDKWLLDWQNGSDCKGDLYTESRNGTTIITAYPQLGKSVFPQICDVPQGWVTNNLGIQAIPQNIILTDGSRSDQFTVGVVNGPIQGTTTLAGSTSFIPKINNIAYLVGKSYIELALGVLLVNGTDYIFNSVNGEITLLQGRIFNNNETYTIFSYV